VKAVEEEIAAARASIRAHSRQMVLKHLGPEAGEEADAIAEAIDVHVAKLLETWSTFMLIDWHAPAPEIHRHAIRASQELLETATSSLAITLVQGMAIGQKFERERGSEH
jgi:hypothetical protein